MTVLLAFTIGLAAFLMFSIEPLAAKKLLPPLGGSAAVWNTAMAFFQVALLLGYLAAHVTNTWVRPRWRLPVQLLVLTLPLITLPFRFAGGGPSGSPVIWELLALLVAVGAPFFALATFSPTVQGWVGASEHPLAADPFFLYSASNVGSFLGLLAYPVLVEPNIGLSAQVSIAAWIYGAFAAFAIVTAAVVRPSWNVAGAGALREQISSPKRLSWVAAAAVPALTLMAVTRHVSTDVASFPLLWVVPLALYLATFIVSFSSRSATWATIAARAFPPLAIIAATASTGVITDLLIGISVPWLVLIASGVIGHGRLFAQRPGVAGLTEFYLWVSVGGALGGMLGAFAAPAIFDSIAEYPISLVATAALLIGRPVPSSRKRIGAVILWAGLLGAALMVSHLAVIGLLVGLAGVGAYVAFGRSIMFAIFLAGCLLVAKVPNDGQLLTRERTFYGVYEVIEMSDGVHLMVSGTTVHGLQRFEPEVSVAPRSYYIPEGPFGQLMSTVGKEAKNLAVIGLGAGAQASYLQPGQHLTYFEIDPVVGDLANDTSLFTYTASSEGSLDFVYGDGRLALQSVSNVFDLLVVDAFTSDAIPTHLLTVEAAERYLATLTNHGVLGFHITNRHLDLEPVLGRLADHLDLEARIIDFTTTDPYGSASTFVVMAVDGADIGELVARPGWRPLRIGVDLWTDDFTNVLGVIR